MQEDCINHADMSGQKKTEKKKKKRNGSISDNVFILFLLLLTDTKRKSSRFKCYIKMSSKSSAGNNTSEGKRLPEADLGFFVCGAWKQLISAE